MPRVHALRTPSAVSEAASAASITGAVAGGAMMVQVTDLVTVWPRLSVTEMAAVFAPPVAGLPVIAPVVALILRPAGRPVLLQVKGPVPPLAAMASVRS